MTRAKEMRDLPLAIDVDSSGNVGIGTTAPGAKLEIDGGITQNTTKIIVSGNDALVRLGELGSGSGPHGIQFGHDSGSADGMSIMYRTASDAITFEDSAGTSGSKVMTVLQTGNVGIGTTGPATSYGRVLHIHDTGTSGANLRLTDATSGAGTGNGMELIQLGVDSYIINRELGDMSFYTGGMERITMHADGHLGFGDGILNDSPWSTVFGARSQWDEMGTIAATNGSMQIGHNWYYDAGGSTGYKYIAGGKANRMIHVNDYISWEMTNSTGSAGGEITFVEVMKLTADGKLGIGTTNPAVALDVVGDVAITSSTDAKVTINDNIGEVGAGNLAFQASNSAGSALKPMGFRGEDIRFATGSAERMRIEDGGLTLYSNIGANSSTAFASMDGRIGFDTDYSDSARGPNKILLQNDGNWISGLGISNNYLDIYSGGNIAFHRSTSPNAYTNNMTIQYDGKVGIGTASPLRNFSVIGTNTTSSGYKDIAEFLEPSITGGTVSVNFGVANSLNNLGKVDFTYMGAGSTDNWVSIGFHSNDNKLKVYANGLVEVASYLKSKKGTIQTVVNQPTVYTSANPVNVWAEVNSLFRVSITPRFSSGTMILGTYSVPINPTGASNILMAIQPWYSTDGGTTKTMLNQGGPSGSRLTGSQAWFRSSNGFDGNDMQNHVVHFGYTHSATTTLTWGFYFRSEGSNTTYFCQSNGNSTLWGWTAPIYMELREVEIA